MLFAWCIFSSPFPFSLSALFCLKCISCKEPIFESCFFLNSLMLSLHLMICVISDMIPFKSTILLFVIYLHQSLLYFFPLLFFLPSFGLSTVYNSALSLLMTFQLYLCYFFMVALRIATCLHG